MIKVFQFGMAAVICLSLNASLLAQASAPKVILAQRYTDLEHGFSLCPPADTTAEKRTSPAQPQLITWTKRDAATAAIHWTLAVQKGTEAAPIKDLKAYAEAAANKMTAQRLLKDAKASLVQVAKKDAFEITALTADGKFWQKQVWVQGHGGAFLILIMTGPPDGKITLEPMLSAVLETLEIIDVKALQSQTQSNLEAGKRNLITWSDGRIASVLARQPQWFIITNNDKPVGCLVRREAMAEHGGTHGLEIKTRLLTKNGQGATLSSLELFTAADQSYERYEITTSPLGSEKVLQLEQWTKKNDLLVHHVSQGGKDSKHQTKTPSGTYLSAAGLEIVTRMVELDKPATYAFQVYNSSYNGFDTWQLGIVGPTKARIGGKEIPCIRATMQPTLKAEPGELLLDEKGNVLKLRAAWLNMEAAAAEAAEKLFPEAKDLAKE